MITAEDLTFIAQAIAKTNGHQNPKGYAKEVVDIAFPPPPEPVAPVELPPII